MSGDAPNQQGRESGKDITKTAAILLGQILLSISTVLFGQHVFQPDICKTTCLVISSLASGIVVLKFLLRLILGHSLFLSHMWATFTVAFSPIAVGLSAGIFSRFAYIVISSLGSKLDSFILSIALLIISILWFLFTILLPLRETSTVGGNLIITVIGVFAIAMGGTLSALDPQSSMAGTLVGSGLALIAVGLQTYYAERQKRPEATP